MPDVFVSRENSDISRSRGKATWRHWEKTHIWNQGERVRPALLTPWSWTSSLQTEQIHFCGLSCPVLKPSGTSLRQLEQNNSVSVYCPFWLSMTLAFSPCLSEFHWVIFSDSAFQILSFCVSLSSVYHMLSFILYFFSCLFLSPVSLLYHPLSSLGNPWYFMWNV